MRLNFLSDTYLINKIFRDKITDTASFEQKFFDQYFRRG